MTLVIALKVGDGIVLGADSASTIVGEAGYVNSYFNAEKLFNLRKGLPVGAVTFGLGGLGGRSVGSLAKDLRQRFADESQPEWYLPPESYTIEAAALGIRKFFFEELYTAEYAGAAKHHDMGFFVAGYSAGIAKPEIWSVMIKDGTCELPPKATLRMRRGASDGMGSVRRSTACSVAGPKRH